MAWKEYDALSAIEEKMLPADVGSSEHAFASNRQAIAEGSDGFQEGTRIGCQIGLEHDGAGLVQDAQRQSSGMQIDAGVEWGRHFEFVGVNVFPGGPGSLAFSFGGGGSAMGKH